MTVAPSSPAAACAAAARRVVAMGAGTGTRTPVAVSWADREAIERAGVTLGRTVVQAEAELDGQITKLLAFTREV